MRRSTLRPMDRATAPTPMLLFMSLPPGDQGVGCLA